MADPIKNLLYGPVVKEIEKSEDGQITGEIFNIVAPLNDISLKITYYNSKNIFPKLKVNKKRINRTEAFGHIVQCLPLLNYLDGQEHRVFTDCSGTLRQKNGNTTLEIIMQAQHHIHNTAGAGCYQYADAYKIIAKGKMGATQ